MEEEIVIGKVVEYIDMIGSALIELTDGPMSIGDSIHVKGPMTNLSQIVEEMYVNGDKVERAEIGRKVKVTMDDKVQVGDMVHHVVLKRGA